jgi:Putative porin
MQKHSLFIACLLAMATQAQVQNKTDNNVLKTDTLVVDNGKKDSIKIFKPQRSDYQFSYGRGPKQAFDSIMSIQNFYKYSQYNHRDNFGRLQGSNLGTFYNPLTYEYRPEDALQLVPMGKSFFLKNPNDIKYYDVKTPTTIFKYNSGVSDGVALTTTYTQNWHKKLNFFVEYTGLKSLGNYRRQLAGINHILVGAHYQSPNGKYEAFGHFIHQLVNNEEHGGISDLAIFESGDKRFNNRNNFTVNLINTYSQFTSRRYYLNHDYLFANIYAKLPIKLRHEFNHQVNKYRYFEQSRENFYQPNDVFANLPTYSYAYSHNISNSLVLVADHSAFSAQAGLKHVQVALGSDRAYDLPSGFINQKYTDQRLGFTGSLSTKYRNYALQSALDYHFGSTFGNLIQWENTAKAEVLSGYPLQLHANYYSHKPSFNLMYSPNFYQNYAFYNPAKLQNTILLGGQIESKKYRTTLGLDYQTVVNYSYFDAELNAQQAPNLNIIKISADQLSSYKQFYFHSQLILQRILGDQSVLPLPTAIVRLNAYYQNTMFKNAAEVQLGLKINYQTRFNAREFLPLYNELVLPSNAHAIGGIPILDAYANMKVQNFTIYLEAQHLNRLLLANKSYTAPFYPYGDFRLSLGIVWYLFS